MIPLFTSVHLSNNNHLYRPESIEYLKKHQPIGCRDPYTYERLVHLGVDVYMSACLTLGLKNTISDRNDGVYHVTDPILNNHKTGPGINIKHIDYSLAHQSIPQRLAKAQSLLDKYMTAKVVVTDRLHCYLPCLAYGTPVEFVGPTRDIRCQGLVNEDPEKLFQINRLTRNRIEEFVNRFDRKTK